jgi:hypothetical protein
MLAVVPLKELELREGLIRILTDAYSPPEAAWEKVMVLVCNHEIEKVRPTKQPEWAKAFLSILTDAGSPEDFIQTHELMFPPE